MNNPNDIPSGYEWLKDVFTDKEIASITAVYSYETGKFECLGFWNEHGRVSQFAEPEKAEALARLEEAYREELETGAFPYSSVTKRGRDRI